MMIPDRWACGALNVCLIWNVTFDLNSAKKSKNYLKKKKLKILSDIEECYFGVVFKWSCFWSWLWLFLLSYHHTFNTGYQSVVFKLFDKPRYEEPIPDSKSQHSYITEVDKVTQTGIHTVLSALKDTLKYLKTRL